MSDEAPHPTRPELVFDEFAPGDPRRGPHSQAARAEAAMLAEAPNRWHARHRQVDWFAVRLQRGRGLTTPEAARMFDIGYSTIDRRRTDEGWAPVMSEKDRRRLSALVWLAGIERLPPGDTQARDALKSASEWRLKPPPPRPVWREMDRNGDPFSFTVSKPPGDDI